MRFTTLDGRATLVRGGRAHDLERATAGEFGHDPIQAYERWDELRRWADGAHLEPAEGRAVGSGGPPSPTARQVVGIGLNYHAHALELGLDDPDEPVMFAKLPSCLTGPVGEVRLLNDTVDWEAELVVVIGRRCNEVPVAAAWDHVAGLTVGQDFSDRTRQAAGPVDQLSIAKSAPTFGPTGPWLVSTDELGSLGGLEMSCSLNGTVVQRTDLDDMVFGVDELVSRVSAAVELLPGDLVFTGTPAGCGVTSDPQRYLREGDVVTTRVDRIGEMRHICVAPRERGGAPCTSN